MNLERWKWDAVLRNCKNVSGESRIKTWKDECVLAGSRGTRPHNSRTMTAASETPKDWKDVICLPD